MVNAVNQFWSAASASATANGVRDKVYWENVRKASVVLEKISYSDLDRLFDNIYNQQPTETGALVYVLAAKLKKWSQDTPAINRLIEQCNFLVTTMTHEELDFLQDKFSTVMLQFSQFLCDNNIAIHGICILQQAVRLLSRNVPGVLTNLHARLLRMCLDTKRLDPALPFLNLDAANCFLNVQSAYRVSCESALLYFYYGGLLKLALRDFEGAAEMLETCVCMPAIAASNIMLEAMKKLIIINAILNRPQQLPGYRAPPIQRLLQVKCQRYHAIVHAHNEVIEHQKSNNHGISRLNRQLDLAQTELNKDTNYGLATELYWSAIRTNIAKLPEVFSKLQISKVAKYCCIDDDRVCIRYELERFLQRPDITGKIDVCTETVSFAPVESSEDINQTCLDDAAQACVKLGEVLRKAQHVVDLHPVMLARQSIKKHHPTSGVALGE